MDAPRLLKLNGNCGDVAPHPLKLLISPPAERCPVAMGRSDPAVLLAAQLLPGPDSVGVITGEILAVPHYWRVLNRLALEWRREYLEARNGNAK